MSLKVVHTKTGFQIGTVYVAAGKGWHFFPSVSGRKANRVFRYSADEAIPTWAKKMGVCIQYPEFGGN